MANPIQSIVNFYHETVQETKKCTWPNRQELVNQTILVIVTVILLVLFTFGVDWIVTKIVQFIVGMGG